MTVTSYSFSSSSFSPIWRVFEDEDEGRGTSRKKGKS